MSTTLSTSPERGWVTPFRADTMETKTKRERQQEDPGREKRRDVCDIPPLMEWRKSMKNVFLSITNVSSREKVSVWTHKWKIVSMEIKQKGLNQAD